MAGMRQIPFLKKKAAGDRPDGKVFRFRLRYGFAALPVVLVLIAVMIWLSYRSIYDMQRSIVDSLEEGASSSLNSWVGSVISEMEIHRTNIESFFADEEAMEEYLAGTYEHYEKYPLGVYVGDDSGYYADASGWDGGEDYVVTERQWYLEGKDSYAFRFGEPYIDAMTGRICVSVAARMHYDEAVRVMVADLYMDYPESLVRELNAEETLDGVLLVSGKGQIVITGSGQGLDGNTLADLDGQSLTELSGAQSRELAELLAEGAASENANPDGSADSNALGVASGETAVYTLGSGLHKTYAYVTYARAADWYLVALIDGSTLIAPILKFLPLVVLLGVLAILALTWLAGKYEASVAEMQHRATTDKLTGLLNRDGFRRELEPGGKIRTEGMLILLDLDNFKAINDNLGHPEGDKVLTLFAELLSDFFDRPNNRCARIGGDEFAVIITRAISQESAVHMMERFMKRSREAFRADYEAYGLSVSAGAAFCSPERDYDALYKTADALLYTAKTGGKGRFCVEETQAAADSKV